MALLAASFTAV